MKCAPACARGVRIPRLLALASNRGAHKATVILAKQAPPLLQVCLNLYSHRNPITGVAMTQQEVSYTETFAEFEALLKAFDHASQSAADALAPRWKQALERHAIWLLTYIPILFVILLLAILTTSGGKHPWWHFYLLAIPAFFAGAMSYAMSAERTTMRAVHGLFAHRGSPTVRLTDEGVANIQGPSVALTPWSAFSDVSINSTHLFLNGYGGGYYVPVRAFASDEAMMTFARFAIEKIATHRSPPAQLT